jgi:hypothetical protein
MNPVGGRVFGGFGGGWGRRNWFYVTGLAGWQRAAYGYPVYAGAVPYGAPSWPTVTKQQELDGLKGQAEYLKNSLEGIKKRMTELETD